MKRSFVKPALFVALGIAAIVTVLCLRPLPQDPAYHDFADQRPVFDVPHFFNVVSNLPFIAVGGFGLAFVLRKDAVSPNGTFLDARERWPYVAMFFGLFLTGFGSSYYHLRPNNQTLFWDRLPMTIVFMAFFCSTIMERISVRVGARLLLPLLIVGIGSVIHWQRTEMQDRGDLRFYILVQFYPLATIPLLLLMFPPRYTRTGDVFGALGWYVLAKILEDRDASIYRILDVVSGHTLKHLAAAMGAYWLLRMLKKRRPVASD